MQTVPVQRSPLFMTLEPKFNNVFTHYGNQLKALMPQPVPGSSLVTVLLADTASQSAIVDAIVRFMASLASIVIGSSGTPDEKQAAILDAANAFFDTALDPLLATLIGHPIIYQFFVQPLAKRYWPVLIMGIYSAISQIFNVGVPTVVGQAKPVPPPPAAGWQPY